VIYDDSLLLQLALDYEPKPNSPHLNFSSEHDYISNTDPIDNANQPVPVCTGTMYSRKQECNERNSLAFRKLRNLPVQLVAVQVHSKKDWLYHTKRMDTLQYGALRRAFFDSTALRLQSRLHIIQNVNHAHRFGIVHPELCYCPIIILSPCVWDEMTMRVRA
jgi:hypothetical protein